MEYLFIYLLQFLNVVENATTLLLVVLVAVSVFLLFVTIYKIGIDGSSYSSKGEKTLLINYLARRLNILLFL